MTDKKKKLRLEPEVRTFSEILNREFKRAKQILPEDKVTDRMLLFAAVCSALKEV